MDRSNRTHSPGRLLALLSAAVGLALGGLGALAEPYVWVDDQGVTHLTNDPEKAPDSLRERDGADWDAIRRAWDDGFRGERTGTPLGASGSEADRLTRLIRGAVGDLQGGETARAAATLRNVVSIDDSRPIAHWYLALLDRQRGRYDGSERHLERFLELAGPELQQLRESAKQRLAGLADERRLADVSVVRGEFQLVQRESPHFRIHVDSELEAVGAEYATTVLRYLEEARGLVSEQLGVSPQEALGVVFYGRARYDQQHKHRFSFATVGFFDGRIHVASPAHPSGELRALLFHEYTHALYREHTGGDRPYWLNEGLAEGVERRSRKHREATHSERSALRARIDSGTWIPLRSLAQSFSGLGNEDARIAYLEAVTAAAWIEARTTRSERARMLERLAEGFSIDQALHEAVGLDTAGLERALQEQIRAEFPELPEVRPAAAREP